MLSAVIITYNEEKNIRKCLQSLYGIADEIIVVDSDSSDNTVAIAKEFNCIVHNKEFLGYAAQKNFANGLAKFPYILSMDADEVLSDGLQKEIIAFKNSPTDAAYQFKRLTNYAGNWVHHCGWYPDKKIRLFRKENASWEGPALHETLRLKENTTILEFKNDLLHYSFHSEADHLKQIEKFTTIAANDLYNNGKKSNLYFLYIKPVLRFITDYVYKSGFLDGRTGITVCLNSAYAMHLKYRKLKKLQDANHSS
jgi:glycosyltransferase involved in cell wall biosynthesis